MTTFKDLKRQAEAIGVEGTEKTTFLTQGWKMIQEAEERKLAVETQERRLKLEAEERKLAAEAAEREAERKHKLEIERLQLERERLTEHGSVSSEDQQMGSNQAFQENAIAKAEATVLPGFGNRKDNLYSHLLRFERYATVACWRRSNWATRLSPLLSGRALGVYYGLSDEQLSMIDYRRLFCRDMTLRNKASARDSEEISRRHSEKLLTDHPANYPRQVVLCPSSIILYLFRDNNNYSSFAFTL